MGPSVKLGSLEQCITELKVNMLKVILIALVLLILFWLVIGKELFIAWYSGVEYDEDD